MQKLTPRVLFKICENHYLKCNCYDEANFRTPGTEKSEQPNTFLSHSACDLVRSHISYRNNSLMPLKLAINARALAERQFNAAPERAIFKFK